MNLNEGVRRLSRLAKSTKLGDFPNKDFTSAYKKVERRNRRGVRKYGQAELANRRAKGHEISRNTNALAEGVRRVDRLALSTKAPMSAFRKAAAKLSRRNAKYFEKNKKDAGPGIDLSPKSFAKKKVRESILKLGHLINELNKYEDYLQGKKLVHAAKKAKKVGFKNIKDGEAYLTDKNLHKLRQKRKDFNDPYSQEGAGLRKLIRKNDANNLRDIKGGVKGNYRQYKKRFEK